MADVKRRLKSARLLAHYFRTAPRLAFPAFVTGPIKRATVCRLIGHDLGNGPFRLLGLCDRCYEDIGAPDA